MARRGPSCKAQVADSGLDAIKLRVAGRRRCVGQAHREVAGGKVERNIPVLEVEGSGAILIVQKALLDGDVAGLQIKKAIQIADLPGLRGLRGCGWLVEPSGIDDQVDLGLENLQIAQPENEESTSPACSIARGHF